MPLLLVGILIVYQALLFFVHAVVFETFTAAFGWNNPSVATLFVILTFSFVGASILAHKFCNSAVKWLYRLSAYWFGLIHFLFIGGIAFFILEYGIYSDNHYVSPLILGVICFGSIFLIHSCATWQTSRTKVTRIIVELPNLPDVWRGKKIVFVSDVHLGAMWNQKFSARVVALIKEESPEAVLIGGDMFDGVKCHSASMVKPFADIHAPQGIYFASGNHEYIEDTAQLLKDIESAGIRILQNESVDLRGIQLAGVDWEDTKKDESFKKILGGMHIDRTKPSILLRHEPNYLPVAEQAGVSLTLSGHTHAGQIFPLMYITRKIYKGFDYGLKKLGAMMVYTSSGVGTWGPPLRLGTKSEIVVIKLI